MPNRIKRVGLTSVQIRPQLAKLLAQLAKKGLSKSEVINEALRQYFIEKEFQGLRSRLIPYAQKKGVYTDEDLERLLR